MKKIAFLSLICLSVISCKKTYTCSCTNYFPDGSVNYSDLAIKATKDDAQTECAAKEIDPQPNSYYRTCHLK